MKNIAIILVCIAMTYACQPKKDKKEPTNKLSKNEFAKFFKIEEDSLGSISIIINDSWENNNTKSYIPREILDSHLERVVCMSTTHISFFDVLNSIDKIVGVSGAKYISNKQVLKRIESGEIIDIGFESTLNYEALIKLSPQLVITYGIKGENNSYIRKIKELGIPVISLGDYLEEHPLGKTEYLKVFGQLLNKRELADSLFNSIKNQYLEIRDQANKTTIRPKVLLNAPWKDVWYIPGEFNYMSTLIKDAGADVLLEKKGISHSFGYSIEEIIKEAHQADFWLNPNDYTTIEALSNINNAITNLQVFTYKQIYNNNKIRTQYGGSDFWEKGVVEPHIILNDLYTIFHNKNKRDISSLKYYIQLE